MKKASEMDSNVLWDEMAEAIQGHGAANDARFELQRRMGRMKLALTLALRKLENDRELFGLDTDEGTSVDKAIEICKSTLVADA